MASGPANATAARTGSGSWSGVPGDGKIRSWKKDGTDAPAAVPSAAVTWNRTVVWAEAQGPSRAVRGRAGVVPCRASLRAQAGPASVTRVARVSRAFSVTVMAR